MPPLVVAARPLRSGATAAAASVPIVLHWGGAGTRQYMLPEGVTLLSGRSGVLPETLLHSGRSRGGCLLPDPRAARDVTSASRKCRKTAATLSDIVQV